MWILILVLAGQPMQVVRVPFESEKLCNVARERIAETAHDALAAARSSYAVGAVCVRQDNSFATIRKDEQ